MEASKLETSASNGSFGDFLDRLANQRSESLSAGAFPTPESSASEASTEPSAAIAKGVHFRWEYVSDSSKPIESTSPEEEGEVCSPPQTPPQPSHQLPPPPAPPDHDLAFSHWLPEKPKDADVPPALPAQSQRLSAPSLEEIIERRPEFKQALLQSPSVPSPAYSSPRHVLPSAKPSSMANHRGPAIVAAKPLEVSIVLNPRFFFVSEESVE